VATYTTRQTLARNLIKLLDKYDLRKKITTCVKDEGSTLNNMTLTTLNSIVSDEVMILGKSFQGTCFEHAFSKGCQYVAVNHEKNYKCLKYVSIEVTQGDLQKSVSFGWKN
jgi:hypothetical protein